MIHNNELLSLIEVGKIGKSTGINGGLKFHLSTDFPQSLQKGLVLQLISPYIRYTHIIKHFDNKKNIIFFDGITDIDQAKSLTNLIAYTSLEDTKKFCTLKEGEYFWFDLIGCEIIENNEALGEINHIERIGMTDYLIIKTSQNLINQKLPKIFLLPYIEPFILKTLPEQKIIFTQGAKSILEAS
ncbi:ribosome maturation factor RimM [Helicobacter sp. 13S00477-4]|uniref:ribosome maturation factor RimM n=1 Tax=Helicobacter sp. 13S00477-4 TaxID=1905759 RepID=UPI000BA74D80|nr:ribosome maturation factor RimM [Helicobacter sp. 13S00477-4]PAF52364.1 16S rRNA processing protein RimM [Helicobacter sp. 13S00477-4]